MSNYSSRVPVSGVDITTSGFSRDPVTGYDRVRREGPIVWQQASRGFLVTGYSDSAAALRDSRLREPDPANGWRKIADKFDRDYSGALGLFSYMPFVHEGPRHLSLRRALAMAVAPFASGHQTFESRIERRIQKVRRNGGFDLVRDFAGDLLFEIMCQLMEIPEDEQGALRPMASLSWALESTIPLRQRSEASEIVLSCVGFLSSHIREHAKAGGSDFISRLVSALPPEEADRATAAANLAAAMLVMGNDAIGACISFAVHRLLRDGGMGDTASQSEWGDLSDDAIRYSAPVDFMNRIASEGLVVCGCPIEKGERIIVSPLCANHDPAEFGVSANTVSKKPGKDIGLAFGSGSHLCVGSRFSRTVVKSAFLALAQLPRMHLAGSPVHGSGRVVRCLKSLPLEFN